MGTGQSVTLVAIGYAIIRSIPSATDVEKMLVKDHFEDISKEVRFVFAKAEVGRAIQSANNTRYYKC